MYNLTADQIEVIISIYGSILNWAEELSIHVVTSDIIM
jgi:hypothetical protein